jgi:hypothetical protein
LGTAVLTRVGGGAFVGTDGGLQWQLDSMATKLEPGPAWLRNAGVVGLAGFYMVRDGKGYGLITGVPSGATCGQTIEVISPSGKSCGKTTFSGGAGQCEFVATRVGYDGTVVQRMAPPAGQCNGGVCNCQFQWWTGFLH